MRWKNMQPLENRLSKPEIQKPEEPRPVAPVDAKEQKPLQPKYVTYVSEGRVEQIYLR